MLIKKKAGKLLLDINVFDVYEGKNIDSNKRSIAYSLTFGATDRTLNDDEINSILESIITDLENKGFEIRKQKNKELKNTFNSLFFIDKKYSLR